MKQIIIRGMLFTPREDKMKTEITLLSLVLFVGPKRSKL